MAECFPGMKLDSPRVCDLQKPRSFNDLILEVTFHLNSRIALAAQTNPSKMGRKGLHKGVNTKMKPSWELANTRDNFEQMYLLSHRT